MQITNIYQAKTQFSKLINQVMAGNQVIIGKAGKPVAKLIPYQEKKATRSPGLWKGKMWMSKDFNKESQKINKMFYGQE